jgi:hypothetical protein
VITPAKEGAENRTNTAAINDFIVNPLLNSYGLSIELNALNTNREFPLVVFNAI